MSNIDYDDLLNMTWDNIPEPVLLPAGQWLEAGQNVAFVKPKTEDGSSKVLFTYVTKAPVDVSPDLLEELGEEYDLSANQPTYTIFIAAASDWDKVRKHVELHGIKMDGKLFDSSGKLAFNKAFKGAEIVATVSQRSYTDANGETQWQNNLSGFRAVTE